jgi:hypothetical protein
MNTYNSETAQSDSAFEVWMKKVDAVCNNRYGISIYDLPDFCFRDAFDDGETPASVVREAITVSEDY